MFVRSERLILDSFVCSDTEALFEIAHDDEVRHYVPYAYCETLEQAQKLLLCYMKYDEVHDFGIAIRTSNGNLAGVLLANRYLYSGPFEICYFIKKTERNKGYCAEALKLFVQYIRQKDWYCQLFFEVRPKNLASRRVLASLGIDISDYTQEYFTYDV